MISLRSSIYTRVTYITTTIMMEWSTRRIINLVLSTSDQFHVALPDPGDPDLDGSDVFFSAGENEDIDVLDDNLVTENDKFDIDRACRGAGGTVDDEPDAEFQPDGNGVCQGMKEVVQLRVGLNRETLVEVLENQWNRDSALGIS